MILRKMGIVSLPRRRKSGMRRIRGVMPRITEMLLMRRKSILISSPNRLYPSKSLVNFVDCRIWCEIVRWQR